MSLPEKLRFVSYYHQLLITVDDAMTYNFNSKAAIVALYSLTNTNNKVEDLKKFLLMHYNARTPVLPFYNFRFRLNGALQNGSITS